MKLYWEQKLKKVFPINIVSWYNKNTWLNLNVPTVY